MSIDPVPPLIRIRGLSKGYRRGGQVIPVLLDLDMDVAAALAAGCEILYSEDMRYGQVFIELKCKLSA